MKPVVNPVLFRISVSIRWKNSLLLREKGGVEAEREERERWITREQQKIMDSFNGKRIQPFLTKDLWVLKIYEVLLRQGKIYEVLLS